MRSAVETERSERWGLVGVVGGVAALLLAVFVIGARTRAVEPGTHERYSTDLARLETLDHRLNEDLMRARTGLLANYDPLVATMAELRRVHERLGDTPAYLDRSGRRTLSEAVRRSRGALTEQGELLERFKSENAILLNSLRYLPVAADSLAARVTDAAALAAIDTTVRDVLVLNLWNDPDASERVRVSLDALRSHPAVAPLPEMEIVDLHARVIIERRPRVQRLLDRILELHGTREAHRLDDLYRSHHAIAARRAQSDDIILFVVALMGVVAVSALVIFRLRRAAQALQRTSNALALAVDTKNRFVSMTSHEFRTPLSVILSSTELLEAYADRWAPEKRRQHFERIRGAIHGMSQLIDGVLLIGRGDAGVLDFKPGPTDVERICQEVLAAVRQRTGAAHDIELVPPAVKDVIADERLLRHILDNLLTNAVKYSPRGGAITLSVSSDGATLTLRVSDSGMGIPEGDRAGLFESFRRGTNVGAIPGTGLGLAVVKRAVDLHGGSVGVESTIGVGSTFEVVIPVGRSEQP